MARKIAGGFGKQAAFALALACLLMPVMPASRAEDAAAPPVAPPMSPPCDVPAMDIAAPATLPNVTRRCTRARKCEFLRSAHPRRSGTGLRRRT